MSNYTYSTNFGAKDALNTGDPNKLIKGVDFDTEFNAISTAIATKADSNSDAVTLGNGAVSSGGGGTDLYNVAIGSSASAIGTAGIAIGRQASVANGVDNAVAIGISSDVGSSGNGAVAIGRNAEVNGTDQIAIGNDSGNTGTNSETIAIGSNAGSVSQGAGSIAIGKSANSSGSYGVAIGQLSGADAANTIHISSAASATNQPQTAGHMVIETDDAKIEYNGNWDLSTGDLTVNGGVEIGTNWKVRDNGSGVLIFSTGGTDKMKLDASGNLTVVGNVTAYGTI